MPGPMADDPRLRQRRNRVSTAGVIEATPAKMPALGRNRPDSTPETPRPWHRETRRWWKAIWSSAISGRWIDAHVPGLRRLARLVDDYWQASSAADAKLIHAEIRLAEREFGLSPMAARSLNWEFRRPSAPPQQAAPLPPGADPRKVLTMTGRRSAG